MPTVWATIQTAPRGDVSRTHNVFHAAKCYSPNYPTFHNCWVEPHLSLRPQRRYLVLSWSVLLNRAQCPFQSWGHGNKDLLQVPYLVKKSPLVSFCLEKKRKVLFMDQSYCLEKKGLLDSLANCLRHLLEVITYIVLLWTVDLSGVKRVNKIKMLICSNRGIFEQ